MDFSGRKTMSDLKHSGAAFFTADDICGVLQADPHTIRLCAKQRPDLLGFPVIVMGSRVKIPATPFLRFMGEV